MRTTGIEPVYPEVRDFKSLASTSFATSANPAPEGGAGDRRIRRRFDLEPKRRAECMHHLRGLYNRKRDVIHRSRPFLGTNAGGVRICTGC